MIYTIEEFVGKVHKATIQGTHVVCACGWSGAAATTEELKQLLGHHRFVRWTLNKRSQGIFARQQMHPSFTEVHQNAVDTKASPVSNVKGVAPEQKPKVQNAAGVAQKPSDGPQEKKV